MKRLRYLSDSCETLVHDAPERSYCLGLVVEKALEKSSVIERGRIGVPLTIVPVLTNPIPGFARVEHSEQARRIQIRPARIIQNSEFAAFDSDDDVRLPGRQISIS